MDVDRAMDLYKVYNQVRSDAPTDDTASASTDTESRLPNVYWYTQNRAAQQQDDIHTFFQNFFKANGKFSRNFLLLTIYVNLLISNVLLKVFWVRSDLSKHSIPADDFPSNASSDHLGVKRQFVELFKVYRFTYHTFAQTCGTWWYLI